jgi:hypothetical protein
MSFSQYSGSAARLTSVRPNRGKFPNPKSVTSHLGLGGSAQQNFLKQAEALRQASLISDLFMQD